VIEIAGRPIDNIYDYSHALDGLKANQPVEFAVVRNGERLSLELVPAVRE
jgi:S1-C subfamily serine protease